MIKFISYITVGLLILISISCENSINKSKTLNRITTKRENGCIYHIMNGQKHGEFTCFYPDSGIKTTGYYYRGKLDSIYKIFYENGNIEAIYNYNEGIPIGMCYYYDSIGKLIKRIEFIDTNIFYAKNMPFFNSPTPSRIWYYNYKGYLVQGDLYAIKRMDSTLKIRFHFSPPQLTSVADSFYTQYIIKLFNPNNERYEVDTVLHNEQNNYPEHIEYYLKNIYHDTSFIRGMIIGSIIDSSENKAFGKILFFNYDLERDSVVNY